MNGDAAMSGSILQRPFIIKAGGVLEWDGTLQLCGSNTVMRNGTLKALSTASSISQYCSNASIISDFGSLLLWQGPGLIDVRLFHHGTWKILAGIAQAHKLVCFGSITISGPGALTLSSTVNLTASSEISGNNTLTITYANGTLAGRIIAPTIIAHSNLVMANLSVLASSFTGTDSTLSGTVHLFTGISGDSLVLLNARLIIYNESSFSGTTTLRVSTIVVPRAVVLEISETAAFISENSTIEVYGQLRTSSNSTLVIDPCLIIHGELLVLAGVTILSCATLNGTVTVQKDASIDLYRAVVNMTDSCVVQGEGTLDISLGSLYAAGRCEAAVILGTGGIVYVTKSWNITGLFTWEGTIKSTGVFHFINGNIPTTAIGTLYGCAQNDNNFILNGEIVLNSNSTFISSASAKLYLYGTVSGSSDSQCIVRGTVLSFGSPQIIAPITLDGGFFNVVSGESTLTYGGSSINSGTWSVAYGANLQFSWNFFFGASRFNGTGSILFTSGTFTFTLVESRVSTLSFSESEIYISDKLSCYGALIVDNSILSSSTENGTLTLYSNWDILGTIIRLGEIILDNYGIGTFECTVLNGTAHLINREEGGVTFAKSGIIYYFAEIENFGYAEVSPSSDGILTISSLTGFHNFNQLFISSGAILVTKGNCTLYQDSYISGTGTLYIGTNEFLQADGTCLSSISLSEGGTLYSQVGFAMKGTLIWDSGTITGPSPITIYNYLQIQGEMPSCNSCIIIIDSGSAKWIAGNFLLSGTATLTILASGTFSIPSSVGTLTLNGCDSCQINCYGSFYIESDSTVTVYSSFRSYGYVDVSGTFYLHDWYNSGVVSVAEAGTIQVLGIAAFASTSSVSGSGTLVILATSSLTALGYCSLPIVDQGVLQIDGNFYLSADLTLDAGILAGGGSLTATRIFVSSNGACILLQVSCVTMDIGGDVQYANYTVTNTGVVTWRSGALSFADSLLVSSGSSSKWVISSSDMAFGNGYLSAKNGALLIFEIPDDGTCEIPALVDINSSVNAVSGTTKLISGYNKGEIVVSATAKIVLVEYRLHSSSVVSGDGTVYVEGSYLAGTILSPMYICDAVCESSTIAYNSVTINGTLQGNGVFENDDVVQFLSNDKILVLDGIANAGVINWDIDQNVFVNISNLYAGTIKVSAASGYLSGFITSAGTISLELQDTSISEITASIVSSGKIVALSGNMQATSIVQTDGSLELNGGNITCNLDLQGGQVCGEGTLFIFSSGTMTSKIDASISPGFGSHSIGFIEIQGTISGSFSYVVEIGGRQIYQYDQLGTVGLLTEQVQVFVILINSFLPIIGDKFVILLYEYSYTSYSFTYSGLDPRVVAVYFYSNNVTLEIIGCPQGMFNLSNCQECSQGYYLNYTTMQCSPNLIVSSSISYSQVSSILSSSFALFPASSSSDDSSFPVKWIALAVLAGFLGCFALCLLYKRKKKKIPPATIFLSKKTSSKSTTPNSDQANDFSTSSRPDFEATSYTFAGDNEPTISDGNIQPLKSTGNATFTSVCAPELSSSVTSKIAENRNSCTIPDLGSPITTSHTLPPELSREGALDTSDQIGCVKATDSSEHISFDLNQEGLRTCNQTLPPELSRERSLESDSLAQDMDNHDDFQVISLVHLLFDCSREQRCKL